MDVSFGAARSFGAPVPRLTPSRAPKILLYSHDTFGLGNIRRTLLLAETLGAAYEHASLLIVTGSPVIHDFRIPRRTDYVKLPCLDRPNADCYSPSYLTDRAREVADIRHGMLLNAFLGFGPDLVIVDKRAGGIGGELIGPLRMLRKRQPGVKVVLGIRDILDEPQTTRLSLKRTREMATIARYYDEVWIYGERAIFDAVTEYRFPPAVAARTRYCGYLKRPTRAPQASDGAPRVLVTTGGGGDGTDLIETYLEGLVALPRRIALRSTVVFGPQMPPATQARLRARFGRVADVTLIDFEPDLTARYAGADVVVSMAGYNTVCELLSFGLRAVLVPRGRPVAEQLLRARLFAANRRFEIVEPDQLQPAALMTRVLAALERPVTEVPVNLDGLPRIHERVRALLGADIA